MEINKTDKLARPENLDRQKAVSMALMSIEKQFGKGSIMKLGEGRKLAMDLGVVSTGVLGLDLVTGIGGLPRGRVTEIYGPESSGKTTIALLAIAQAQREGGVCAFIDAEHALDVVYAKKLGVNTDDLLISQPDTGEQALEIAEILVRSGGVDVVVIDSVAALVPRAELEGDMGDSHMGLQARLMSQALRKLTGCISKSKTSLIFINQLRMKIGVMFGNPETTTGGNALKFYASLRMDIRRVSAIKNGDDVLGSRTRVKVVKNKMAPPFREVEFDILFGEGISREGDILDLGCQYGVVEKSGSWFAYNGEKLGQGRDNTRQFLKEHPEFVDKIRKQVEAKAVKDGGLVLSSQASTEETQSETVEKPELKDKVAGRTPTDPGHRGNPKKGD
ncbi:MAG: recombinase RecA [Proteobacteria bacterium]|nr:recombinase RecA [Pseudomonadota bacterium]NDD05192.1 recombinase RecA [Pseudomonadota bacterium]NDG26444.1 recombinase RecA [Pseudomonadota bacterium]